MRFVKAGGPESVMALPYVGVWNGCKVTNYSEIIVVSHALKSIKKT